MTSPLRLGVLGDVHLTDPPHPAAAWHNPYDFDGLPARLRRAVHAFARAGVDAVCLIGDLSHDGSLTALAPLAQCLADLDCRVLVAAGNHDRGGGALTAALPGAELALAGGREIAGWRVAGLQVCTGPVFGASLQVAPPVSHWGSDPVVLLSHFPVCSFATDFAQRGMPYSGDVLDRAAVQAALTGRDAPTIVISGHIHARASCCDGPLLQLVQGALVEAPYESSLLEITAARVTRHAVELEGPATLRPGPALAPASQTFALTESGWAPIAPPGQAMPISALPVIPTTAGPTPTTARTA